MPQQTLPCTDCDEARARLERLGFTVHGCTPDAQHPGMCTLGFDLPPAAGPAGGQGAGPGGGQDARQGAGPGALQGATPADPPGDPVAAQLAAYNAQQLDAFCACYRDDVVVESGDGTVRSRGIAAFRARYAELFARFPQNRAALVARMRIGPWVVDEELVTGRGGPPMRAVAVYRLQQGRIASVRFLSADDGP
jgi:hypothetical protein